MCGPRIEYSNIHYSLFLISSVPDVHLGDVAVPVGDLDEGLPGRLDHRVGQNHDRVIASETIEVEVLYICICIGTLHMYMYESAIRYIII